MDTRWVGRVRQVAPEGDPFPVWRYDGVAVPDVTGAGDELDAGRCRLHSRRTAGSIRDRRSSHRRVVWLKKIRLPSAEYGRRRERQVHGRAAPSAGRSAGRSGRRASIANRPHLPSTMRAVQQLPSVGRPELDVVHPVGRRDGLAAPLPCRVDPGRAGECADVVRSRSTGTPTRGSGDVTAVRRPTRPTSGVERFERDPAEVGPVDAHDVDVGQRRPPGRRGRTRSACRRAT